MVLEASVKASGKTTASGFYVQNTKVVKPIEMINSERIQRIRVSFSSYGLKEQIK